MTGCSARSTSRPLQAATVQKQGFAVLALFILTVAGVARCPAAVLTAGTTLESGDGYIRAETDRWVFGTAQVEKAVALREGHLRLESFKNKNSGREMVPTGRPVAEISNRSLGINESGPWRLETATAAKLAQGELELQLTLSSSAARVTKTYVVYPGSSVLREWIRCENRGANNLRIVEPQMLGVAARLGKGVETLDFHWMTGAENYPGCWTLRTEKLAPNQSRKFDSYDPFPSPRGRSTGGDGIDARITLNDRQIWPADGWQYCATMDDRPVYELRVNLAKADRLRFIVNKHGNIGYDTTEFDPTITYEDGETHVASREFSGVQGQNGWRYGYLEKNQWHDLAYYPEARAWRLKPDNATHTPFVMAGLQHPHVEQDAVREWTAPRAGRVRITGSVCNVGDAGLGKKPGGHRMASSSYAPWYALYDTATLDGLVIGWDFMGHWASDFTASDDGTVVAALRVAGHKQTLAPGESVTLPKAFVALFREDLDEAGNELLDWQYRYLWDYTRKGWFPAVPMLGYWYKGTGWGQPGVGWTGGNGDIPSQFTKIFRAVDLMRYVGGDVYHRDWGWWDRAGDWNGPDFGTANRYLRKHDMRLLVYAFLYTVDLKSKVAREHPDWLIGNTLDMSRPEVVEHIKRQLDDFHGRWGDFAWRNDSTPTAPRNGDDTVLLGQDQGLREVIRYFLDKYPRSSFQSVNGGGNEAGYDYVRLSGMFQFSDAAIGILRNYWASLLFPPDKLEDNGDAWNPDRYDKATWRGLLCIAIMTTGDTWDKAKLEGVRELFDIYHYLAAQGVVGRWVRVYRPRIDGDDPTMYFQRLSRDRRRGLIVPKRPAPGRVTIRPKGLLPEEDYIVTFHESPVGESRSGRDLMQEGLTLERMPPGELIYLNLPLHPGSRRDMTPPEPPDSVVKQRGENMGFPGVELSWKPGRDDNWISYYEILRNGRTIDKLAKGTFYFDHSAGADLAARYEVRTVDGSGNVSPAVGANGPSTPPSQVFDDADPAMNYAGAWRRKAGLQPAHAETISVSKEKGATAKIGFEGKRVLWFSKLGDDCGIAEIRIDGGPAERVDTYCSDDVWGVCVLRKNLSTGGPHHIRIVVSGDRNSRSKDCHIYIDGFRAEP